MRLSVAFAVGLASCSSGSGSGGDEGTPTVPNIDQDCDGVVDDGAQDAIPTWIDADGDGFGGQEPAATMYGPIPAGLAGNDDDCDDADAMRHPGAFESCNGIDDDCDRMTPEGVSIAERAFPSLADAAAGAADGDTITLCDGTYAVPTVDVLVDLTIAGSAGDRDAVIVEGEGDGSLFVVGSTGELTLESVTLRGGVGEFSYVAVSDDAVTAGGAIHALAGGPVTLRDCVVTANGADVGGGIAAADLTIENSDLFDNEAIEGGAVYVREDGQLTLEDSTVRGNFAWRGGGLYSLGDAVLTGNDVGGNIAWFIGGGAYLVNGMVLLGVGSRAPTFDLVSTTFTKNDAELGGGVFLQSAVVTADATTELVDNYADYGGGVYVWCEESGATWTGGTFTSNTASRGGAAFVANYATGACVLEDIEATSNTAGRDGGGVVLAAGSIELSRSALSGNSADEGGGLHVGAAAVGTLAGSTVEANVAGEGGGAWVETGALLLVEDTSFGTEANDNTPDDVWVGGTSYGDYGVVVELACDGNAAECD